jgi:hypoxanthine phosphoribosyltransferase
MRTPLADNRLSMTQAKHPTENLPLEAHRSHETAEYSWADTDRLTRALAARLSLDGFIPDAIIGIARGGCIPAVHLSHLLKVRPFYAVHFQTTLSDAVRAPRILPKPFPSPQLAALRGLKVLVVDDVINTGETMRAAIELVEGHTPGELRSAALVWDKLSPDGLAALEMASCDYWIESVDAWVIFPWNK